MAIITTLEAAKARLKFELQFDTPPSLTETDENNDIEMILEKWHRATVWATGTAYSVGDIVIPVTQNGHRFKCVTGGTSGATQPTWTTADFSTVGDGTVLWEEDGKQYDLWDLEMAVHYGWGIKRSKAAAYIGNEDGLEQVYQHCAEMEQKTKPARVA